MEPAQLGYGIQAADPTKSQVEAEPVQVARIAEADHIMSNCFGVKSAKEIHKHGPPCRLKTDMNPFDDGGRLASRARARAAQWVSETKAVYDASMPLRKMWDNLHYKDKRALNKFFGYREGMKKRAEGGLGLSDAEYSPHKSWQMCQKNYYMRHHWFEAAEIICRWRAAGSPDLNKSENERRPISDKAIAEEQETGAFGQTSGRQPVLPLDNGAIVGGSLAAAAVVLVLLLLRRRG